MADIILSGTLVIALIVLAIAVHVILLRWLFSIDYRIKQVELILEALERIENSLRPPAE